MTTPVEVESGEEGNIFERRYIYYSSTFLSSRLVNLVIPFNLGLLVRLKFLDLILNQLLSKKNKQTKNTEKYGKRVDCIEKNITPLRKYFEN